MAELADRIRSQDRRDREREVYCAFGCADEESELKSAFGLRIQPIDATHWAKRSAGVSKLSVSLGRSFRRRATALSLF
jgi:hypothetical protein